MSNLLNPRHPSPPPSGESGPEHFAEASSYAAKAAEALREGNMARAQALASIGQVHATLAAASAAVQDRGDVSEWRRETAPNPESPHVSHSLPVGVTSDTAFHGLARITIYGLRYGNEDSGYLLLRQEVVNASSKSELIKIDSLRTEYEHSDASDRGEALKAAAADYVAARVENNLAISWWKTSGSLPLSNAADVLNNSAEWLRSLAERPLAAAAQAAGAGGPVVPIWMGITAQLATARLTEPLEDAARICEVVGVLVGLATGMHTLVVACGNRLAKDKLGGALAGVFERALDPQSPNREQPAAGRHSVQAATIANNQMVEGFERSATSAIQDREPGIHEEIQPTDDTNPMTWVRRSQQLDAALDKTFHPATPVDALENLCTILEKDAVKPHSPVDGRDATGPTS